MKKFPIILSFILLLSANKTNSKLVRIAIYDFNSKNVSQNTSKRITDWIRTELAGRGFTIIERNQMDLVLNEQGFKNVICTDKGCAVEIGKLLSANKILVGTLENYYGKYIISGRLVDIEKGIAEFSHTEKVSEINKLDICAERFVENFSRKMKEGMLTEGMVKTGSGLKYLIIKKGNGPKPLQSSMVKVHYTGSFTNGDIFDDSRRRGKPAVFPLRSIIKGWQEGLQLMPVGSKYKFFIPAKLGYGRRGAGKVIPPDADLIFVVELMEIVRQ